MSTRIPSKVKALLESNDAPGWAIRLAKERSARKQRWFKDGAPFPVGQKDVFLPNFTITFMRTPSLSPWWAKFQVPLNFNKLDLRDYLWHAYNVKVRAIRTYIRGGQIQQKPRGHPTQLPGKRATYRPQMEKFMTVELEKPFVWPEEPKGEELQAWDHDRYLNFVEQSTMNQTEPGKDDAEDQRIRKSMRERAEALLSGREVWKEVDASTLISQDTSRGSQISAK